MTLRSAVRPRWALARHSVGTCISSGTLKSHLYFTSITLVIHLFLSNSNAFHLWVTWSAKCPVNASSLTYQCSEASFYEALTNFLVSRKGFTSFGPIDFISMPLLSLHGLFSDTPRSFSFSCDQWLNKGCPHSCPCQSSSYLFLVSVKTIY